MHGCSLRFLVNKGLYYLVASQGGASKAKYKQGLRLNEILILFSCFDSDDISHLWAI